MFVFPECQCLRFEELDTDKEGVKRPKLNSLQRQFDEAVTAIQQDDLNCLKGLLYHHPKILNATNKNGFNLLHFTALANSPKCTKLLLAYGLSPNQSAPGGWTPLHACAVKENYVIARLLILAGADIRAVDNFGWKPPTWAIFCQNMDRGRRKAPVDMQAYCGLNTCTFC